MKNCDNVLCPKTVGEKPVVVAIHGNVYTYCSFVCSLDGIAKSLKEIDLTIEQIRKACKESQ